MYVHITAYSHTIASCFSYSPSLSFTQHNYILFEDSKNDILKLKYKDVDDLIQNILSIKPIKNSKILYKNLYDKLKE